jgi:hypothetical protein
VTPSKKYFCKEKNNTNIGITEMQAPAIIGDKREPLANLNVLSPTWIVYISSFDVTRNGQKKVFQEFRNVFIAITDRIVFDKGRIILLKIIS